MNNIPSIKDLRSKGFKVKLFHYRLPMLDYFSYSDRFLKNNFDTLLRGNNELDGPNRAPKGGKSTVEIFDPEGHGPFVGESVCSIRDPFNRRLGSKIALSRALSTYSQD